ncbi:MAG: hypothetical protein U0556_08105 [Dehalococcoidia bacterium]
MTLGRAVALLVLLFVAGCGPGGPNGALPEPTVPAEAAGFVADAKAKLASDKGADLGQIVLKSIEPTTFNDSSLGCPEPGRSYLQVITPGYLITLQYADQSYEYHAGRNAVVRCDGK